MFVSCWYACVNLLMWMLYVCSHHQASFHGHCCVWLIAIKMHCTAFHFLWTINNENICLICWCLQRLNYVTWTVKIQWLDLLVSAKTHNTTFMHTLLWYKQWKYVVMMKLDSLESVKKQSSNHTHTRVKWTMKIQWLWWSLLDRCLVISICITTLASC